MNKRICKLCGKVVDFDEPWCDHETMEESALLNIRERMTNNLIDIAVEIAAKELMNESKPPTASGS